MTLNMPVRIRPTYYRAGEEMTYRSVANRRSAVEARNAERAAFQADPMVQAVRNVRAANMAVHLDMDEARRVFELENQPVAAPAAIGSMLVHPQRAEALARFVAEQGWSANPLESLTPTRSVDQIADQLVGEARRRYDEALAVLRALEGALDGQSPEHSAVEPAAPADPVKRGRGRPPRVILDEDEPILPDQ